MCRKLSAYNSDPEACKVRLTVNAHPELQQAWAEGRLLANIKKNLDTKQGIHHTCARVAAQSRHTRTGKVSRHVYVK